MQNSNNFLKNFLLVFSTTCLIACLNGCARKSIKQEVVEIPELPAFFDTRPTAKKVSYIYAPGITGTEMMMGRYCPQFTAVTGEKFEWHSGGHVIGEPHTAVIFPEIDLNKSKGFTLNPYTIMFEDMRRDLFPTAQRFMQERFNFSVEDNPASSKSVINYSLNLNKANIGQRKDIKTLRKTYKKHSEMYGETDVILYGDSRGAATIFNFIAHDNPTYVKAAVIEAVFDTVEHCIKHFLYHDKGHRAERRLHKTLRWLAGSYRRKGESPYRCVEVIADDIPLLLVTSLKDEVVPPQGTLYIYKRLKERGHKKVHLLILEEVNHSGYMMTYPDDKKSYETVVHAFYAHYGLPHNKAKAADGKNLFATTQPSCDDIKRFYSHLPRCTLCNFC